MKGTPDVTESQLNHLIIATSLIVGAMPIVVSCTGSGIITPGPAAESSAANHQADHETMEMQLATPPMATAPTTMPPLTTTAPEAEPATAEAATGSEVTIDNFTFKPKLLQIAIGTTVTWINRDDVPHTVAENDKRFKSAALDTDDKFSFTFTSPGEYSYFCGIHPHMTGKIVVK
jgi:plastocyanin